MVPACGAALVPGRPGRPLEAGLVLRVQEGAPSLLAKGKGPAAKRGPRGQQRLGSFTIGRPPTDSTRTVGMSCAELALAARLAQTEE